MDWILIALGAGLGSVLRFEIGRRIARRQTKLKIASTFGVNVSGAFLLGLVVGLSVDGLWWSLLADGLLGGFTTFSTFMVEGVQLIKNNRLANVLLYFASTVALGILAFSIGINVV